METFYRKKKGYRLPRSSWEQKQRVASKRTQKGKYLKEKKMGVSFDVFDILLFIGIIDLSDRVRLHTLFFALLTRTLFYRSFIVFNMEILWVIAESLNTEQTHTYEKFVVQD